MQLHIRQWRGKMIFCNCLCKFWANFFNIIFGVLTIIFDRGKLLRNRNRAALNFHENNFLYQEIAERITEKLLDLKRDFSCILEVGARNGSLGDSIASLKNCELLVQSDIALQMVKLQATKNKIVMDEENLCFRDASFDLIISNMNLHFVNDVLGHLTALRGLLKPDGVMIASFFGGETLQDLRIALYEAEIRNSGGAAARLIPFIDIKSAGMLLQKAGFRHPVADSENISVEYSNVYKLLRDLKNMGEGNILKERADRALNKKMLRDLEMIYRQTSKKADREQIDSRENNALESVEAKFEIITISGWA